MAHHCFKKGCLFEVEYVCLCLSNETCSCEFHIWDHLKLPNRAHIFDSVLEEPCKWTKDMILEFLAKEKSRKEKLKKIVLASFTTNIHSLEESLRNLDYDLEQTNGLIEKISQVSEQEQSSQLSLLSLKPDKDTEIAEKMLMQDSESYKSVQLFCILRQLRKKKSEILNRACSNPDVEEDFKRACSLYENYAFDPLIRQALQELKNDYQKMTSLYLIDTLNTETKLFVYDTKTEREEVKILNFSWKYENDPYTNMTQLPNGELFFISEVDSTTMCFIIDRNYKFRKVQSDWPWKYSSVVYYKRSVYLFGGSDYIGPRTDSSCRFDLDENRWACLAPMPKKDRKLSSIIFKGNIVICWTQTNSILKYSIDIDSFSEIYIEMQHYWRKVLINGEERLYMIDLNIWGNIYESEIEDEYAWKLIGKSNFNPDLRQVYCTYNKGGIYISSKTSKYLNQYFKFDLCQKTLFEVAYYNEHVALKKLDDEFEAIDCPGHTFTLDSDHAQIYFNNKFSLYYIGERLEEIEHLKEAFQLDPNDTSNYLKKGSALSDLERPLEGLECFNKAIKLSPKNPMGYIGKGRALDKLGRSVEAIECYGKAIKLDPKCIDALFNKAYILRELGRNRDAIKCMNEAIKYHPCCVDAYLEKGDILRYLGRNLEALECYGRSSKIYLCPQILTRKGHALTGLNRYREAMYCYNRSINIYHDDFLLFCHRAYLFNSMGQEEDALLDFNKAHDLMNKKKSYRQVIPYQSEKNFMDKEIIQRIIELLKLLSKLQESTIEFKKELQKIQNASLNYTKIIKKIKEKEALAKEQHLKLIKRAIECLNPIKNKVIEAIQKIEYEIIEHQIAKIDIVGQLWELISVKL